MTVPKKKKPGKDYTLADLVNMAEQMGGSLRVELIPLEAFQSTVDAKKKPKKKP